jgi:hypothetical protein
MAENREARVSPPTIDIEPADEADNRDSMSDTAHLAYRHMAFDVFGWEIKTGLNLAFYRTFAIPRIADLLVHTGEIQRRPLKRSMDTGLLMYELIDGGPESERGRTVLRMLNKMHRRWPITDEDYQYVLTTFIVVPTRFIDQYAWRKTKPEERETTTSFYAQVGRRMGIRQPPGSYSEAADFFDTYESTHLRQSPSGVTLMAQTTEVLKDLFPRRLRSAATLLNRLLLDDRLCETFELRPPHRVLRTAFTATLRLRSKAVAHGLKKRKKPIFRPGRSGSSVYPDGYELSDLGVDT